MFKSVILASLLLTSQVLGYYDGEECDQVDITENRKVCDQYDSSRMLKCVAVGDSSSKGTAGVWKFAEKCSYCCSVSGHHCVFSMELCTELLKTSSLDEAYLLRKTAFSVPISSKPKD